MSFWQRIFGAWGSTPEPDTQASQSTAAPAAGQKWTLPLTYTTDPEIGRPGYYGLDKEGRALHDPVVMLTYIDEAPGNDEDGSGYWVVADPSQPYFSHAPHHEVSRFVNLEAQVKGTSSVSGGEPHGSR